MTTADCGTRLFIYNELPTSLWTLYEMQQLFHEDLEYKTTDEDFYKRNPGMVFKAYLHCKLADGEFTEVTGKLCYKGKEDTNYEGVIATEQQINQYHASMKDFELITF